MTPRLARRALCAGACALLLAASAGPAGALVVFDPSNYAQNVLTAARALQQVNNQITALQN
jgi:P-type conjugative transfer protein TrbJ